MLTLVSPSKTPLSVVTQEFNFIASLVNGATISSGEVTVDVLVGEDETPEDLLLGSPVVTDDVISQQLTGGVSGVIYQVTCYATLSNGNIPAIQTKIAII